MTAQPIEVAYAAFGDQLAAALVAAEFLTATDLFKVDPAEPIEVDGDATGWTAATMLNMGTVPARTLIGGGAPRFVVERQVRVEIAATAQDKTALDAKIAAGSSAVVAFVGVGADLTLGGRLERLTVTSAEVEDLAPMGQKLFITFALRLRAGDPLGLTPAS